MTSLLIVREDGSIQPGATKAELARSWRDEQPLVWIEFDRPPDPDEQQFLRDLLGIGDSAIEHLTRPHRGPRAVRYRSYMLLVIYDIAQSIDEAAIENDELVLLLGERYLLSVHNGPSERLAGVSQHLASSLDRFGYEIGAIAFALMEAVAEHYLDIVEAVRLQVDALEDRVLNQDEQEGLTELYRLRRQLTGLRRVIAPEASLIGTRSSPFVANPEIQDAMFDVKHNLQRAVEDIDQYLSMLPDILATFEALKSDGLNRIVKLLTVWSIILTAVALLPTVLGISLAREPSISPYWGYVLSVGAMVLAGAAIWYLFKRRGWIE